MQIRTGASSPSSLYFTSSSSLSLFRRFSLSLSLFLFRPSLSTISKSVNTILLSSLPSTQFHSQNYHSLPLSHHLQNPSRRSTLKSDNPTVESTIRLHQRASLASLFSIVSTSLKSVKSQTFLNPMGHRKFFSSKNKKMARFGEEGQGSNPVIEPNFELHHDNRYLFRNLEAYENFTGQFQDRHLCECYFFNKASVTFHSREDAKTIEYIQHWNWEPLINLFEPYLELTTRSFYANLVCKINPFRVTSWACGKEIVLSFENVAEWLGLDNEGDETYLVRNWPRHALGTPDSYKKWFNRNYISGDSLYVTHLPSLHRLLFLFINNILTPKSKIKTNMEHGAVYYLRHLIQLDDITLNIPYIIISHMLSAFGSSVHYLPYAHLIHKIIRLNGTALPSDLELPLKYPQDLVNSLTKIGWIQILSHSGLPQYKPDGRDINDWIFAHEALPNQYWDPEERVEEPPIPNQPEIQPQFVYQPMPMPQAGQEFPFP